MHGRVGGLSKFLHSESYSLPLELVSSSPLPEDTRQDGAAIQNFKERKGHLVAFSFHNSPHHPPKPRLLFFQDFPG